MLLHHLESTNPQATLENPYYFCECTGSNEPSWKDVASHIASSLHKAGKINDPEPREIGKDMYADLFGDYTSAVLGLNSRSRAVRLRELGWEPREKDWRQSYVEDEMPQILKEESGEFSGYKATAGR